MAVQKPLSSPPAQSFSHLSDLEPGPFSQPPLVSLVELLGERALARLGSDLSPNQFRPKWRKRLSEDLGQAKLWKW